MYVASFRHMKIMALQMTAGMHLKEKAERRTRTPRTKKSAISGPSSDVHNETAADAGAQMPMTMLKKAIQRFWESVSWKRQGSIRSMQEGSYSTRIVLLYLR